MLVVTISRTPCTSVSPLVYAKAKGRCSKSTSAQPGKADLGKSSRYEVGGKPLRDGGSHGHDRVEHGRANVPGKFVHQRERSSHPRGPQNVFLICFGTSS